MSIVSQRWSEGPLKEAWVATRYAECEQAPVLLLSPTNSTATCPPYTALFTTADMQYYNSPATPAKKYMLPGALLLALA